MTDNHPEPHSLLKKLNRLSSCMNEVLKEICSLIQSQGQNETAPKALSPLSFEVKLVDQTLWVNRLMIPLGTRPKTLDLIEVFFSEKGTTLAKEQIMEIVYGSTEGKSRRWIESLDGRLTKLMSRTRSFLEDSLTHAYHNKKIDWLVYEPKTKTYHLYQLREWENPFQDIEFPEFEE